MAQLSLQFDRGLPVSVSPLAVRRFVARSLRALPAETVRAGFALRQHLEDCALLDQVRRGVREQARELKRQARERGRRMNGLSTIASVCNPEGRRALRLMDRLSDRIMEREPRLCA